MLDLEALLADPLGVCAKGLPAELADVPLRRIGELGLSLWDGDLLLPALTLRGDRLRHNIARMMRFCDEHGVALAPHGKTTMAPQLFADQLTAGAWGMTAATAGQAQLMASFGVGRIMIANEVLDPRAIRWLDGAEPELYCLVDSVAGVDEVLGRVAELAAEGAAAGLFAREQVLLTAGGSIFFDAAAELTRVPGAEVVLRSGCYLVHDDGIYAAASPLADDPFQPALELWADVLSCPEPGRAIAGIGRRDAPYDAGLPRVLRAYRRGVPLEVEATVTELNDQHAFLTADGLQPGDLLCLGISHPCGAFDRWRTLLEVDADYTVTRAIRTFF